MQKKTRHLQDNYQPTLTGACGKKIYPDKRAAATMRNHLARVEMILHIYHCHHCDGWHLTRNEQR